MPSHEEVATVWVGWSTDDLYFLRLALMPDGSGQGGYAFFGEEPQQFRISSWKYNQGRIEIRPEPPMTPNSWVSPLHGNLVGLSLKIKASGKDWKISFDLRRESDLELAWSGVKRRMGSSEHE
jgi:hypothetical protein